MYTVVVLQEKLEKAKGHLREVEDHLLKVDGKPANTTLRYQKPEFRQVRNWPGVNRQDNDENAHVGNVLGRKVLNTVEDSRRKDNDGGSRRRHVAISSQDSTVQRKRLFPSVGYEEDTSPVRKKAFQSVVGKVQLPDLSVALKRGRERREREKEDEVSERSFAKSRNVFSRLSGPPGASDDQEEDEDDDEIIVKRQPAISSRVEAIERPMPSREEVIATQKQDEARKQRDRRMFGALVGTLQQFRRDETKVKQRDERRLQIEKKLEEDAKKDKERMFEEKRQLQVERKRRESDIKRIEWSLNRAKEFDAWQASMLPLKNFIQTKNEPNIFYLPKILTAKTEKLLEESIITVQGIIDKRFANLNEEIETSERKAKRLAGEEDDINKENEEVIKEHNDDDDEPEEGAYSGDDVETSDNKKNDSSDNEVQFEKEDKGKQSEKDFEADLREVGVEDDKVTKLNVDITEEVPKVSNHSVTPTKEPDSDHQLTDSVIESKSYVPDQVPKETDIIVGNILIPKEIEHTSLKKSSSPSVPNNDKSGLDSKSKEEPKSNDDIKPDIEKRKVRSRSRSRSKGDRRANKSRRSRSLSKRRRRSRSKPRRTTPKRSPIRRRRSLSKRRESPRRRSNDRSRPSRRVDSNKRSGRRASTSRGKSSLSSSSTDSN